ncbi:rhodanese-like domain-containing protein [Henriciella sp. AS95]|uniref:rhodanese-like domain-containing protein n=1 Tax=Henriciella sp. AS95 TaxID=3135782 RepID=UPI00317ACCC9
MTSFIAKIVIVTTLGLSVNLPMASAQGLPPEMPVPRADLMVRKADGLLIDVRTPEEWAQTGVPATAHTISIKDDDFVARVEKIARGDKSKRIALICKSGNRSARARDILIDAGFENVTSVAGGVTGTEGWIDADLPVRPYP